MCAHIRNETTFRGEQYSSSPFRKETLSGNSVFARNGRRRFTNYHLILYSFLVVRVCVFVFCFLFSSNCFALCTRASNEIDNNLGHDTDPCRTPKDVQTKEVQLESARIMTNKNILWKVDGNCVRVVDKTKWKNNNLHANNERRIHCDTVSTISAINCEQQQKQRNNNDERHSSTTQSQSSN